MRIHPVCRAMFGCGLGLLLTASLGFAQEAKLPDGLRHVPLDALGFVHVRASDFVKGFAGKVLLQELRQDRDASSGLKKLEQLLGVAIDDLDSVTAIVLPAPTFSQMNRWDGPWGGRPFYKPRDADMKKKVDFEMEMKFRKEAVEKEKDKENFDRKRKEDEDLKRKIDDDKKKDDKKVGAEESPVLFMEQRFAEPELDPRMIAEYYSFSGAVFIVTSTKALDRKKIMRSHLFPERDQRRHFDDFRGGPEPAVLFLSDRSMMIGAAWEVARYSELMARNPGPKTKPMQSALALAVNPHLVVAGGYVPAELRRLIMTPLNGEMRAFAAITPLLQTETALTLDLGPTVNLTLQFSAPTEASAANALQAVKSLRVLGELAIEMGREFGESGGVKLELEKAATKALAGAAIEQKGNSVHAQVKLELSPAIYKKLTKDIVAEFRQGGDRRLSVNNLKQIALALHTHHDVYKRLPAAGIGDRDGKPLLSWRVAILPFIEQENLYKQFDLNQPWDHPTNKKLIERMPAIFEIPDTKAGKGETHYRVFVGNGAMFEPRMGVRFADIQDGLSNTFMVVEANEPTIWTRPDDLQFDPKGPLPKLGVFPQGFNVAFGDGSVRYVRSTVPLDVIRSYIFRNSGEPRRSLDK